MLLIRCVQWILQLLDSHNTVHCPMCLLCFLLYSDLYSSLHKIDNTYNAFYKPFVRNPAIFILLVVSLGQDCKIFFFIVTFFPYPWTQRDSQVYDIPHLISQFRLIFTNFIMAPFHTPHLHIFITTKSIE